jgi:NAD(P)H-quinone oxidoreductase subunit 6
LTTAQLVFYAFAALALGSALAVVVLRNIVRSIFLFFITLFSMAGLFIFALADFIAITQLVVYVGAVLVLMIFAFLLSNRDLLNDHADKNRSFPGIRLLPGLLVAVLLFGVIFLIVRDTAFESLPWIRKSAASGNVLKVTDNTVPMLGINLMTRYLVPFEVVSVFLLMVLIGAAHLARKERKV